MYCLLLRLQTTLYAHALRPYCCRKAFFSLATLRRTLLKKILIGYNNFNQLQLYGVIDFSIQNTKGERHT